RRPPSSPLFPYTTLFRSTPERGGRALDGVAAVEQQCPSGPCVAHPSHERGEVRVAAEPPVARSERREVDVAHRVGLDAAGGDSRSEEHTSELQSPYDLVC